ncbi:unnamed protein product [Cochlearia groenlandica]
MPMEVERDQGDVSVKVIVENASENNNNNKQEIVASTGKEEVGNGIISHGNGNDKEDSDGSYVFITKNDTVGDDSVKPIVDDVGNVVEEDLKEGENVNSVEVKTEAKSSDDDVLGVSQGREALGKSEKESVEEGPEEVVGIIKSGEIEDPLEKSVELKHPGNGHLDGNLESTEKVEQSQDSEAGVRDLLENNVVDPAYLLEKPEGNVESDTKSDVEGHQVDKVEVQEKSDVGVDVSDDLKHNEDVAKHPVDSDEGGTSELVSAKVSPTDEDVSLGQPTVTDPACTTNGSEFVDDHTGSESVAVLDSVSVENGHPLIESKLEKIGDVPEKVNASDGDVLPDSGTVKVSVTEVSSDIPAETQPLTTSSLDSHTSGKDGVLENGNNKLESEAILDHVIENSKVQSEIGTVDLPVSDAPASEESSDAVIVAKDSVSEGAISDGLSCTNKQESDHTVSGLVEKLPSDALHEDPPSGNDTSVNLSSDTRSQDFSEDHGVDTNQNTQDVCNSQSEEVTDVNGKHPPSDEVHRHTSEENSDISGDICLKSAEEAKESHTGNLTGNVSHESAETPSTNINGPSSLLDSKTAVSDLAENSAEGAAGEAGALGTKSETAQSVKESTEPHVVATTTEDGEINREDNCVAGVNVTETTHEEVSEKEESDIKERSAVNTDEEVDSNSKIFDSTKVPLVSNDTVKASEDEDSGKDRIESSGATASAAQDLESKVVTSTDTVHSGANDCVDSQPADKKEGDAADITDDKLAMHSENGETLKHPEAASSIEGSVHDAPEGQAVAAEIERRPFYFLCRVPRYDDEKLAEQLKDAEAQVDQKTQSRDALRADIQKIRATCKDYDISYKAVMAEERSARKAMHSKRQEIDALQSVISRIKSAASVDDIDSKVHNMEHMIQHETLSLSEEKGLIREMKQLKQLRGQISSSMGTKDEVKQALEEKEKTEERLKVLRKELDGLRSDLSKAEAVSKAAKSKCDEEWEVQSKLQQQFRAADAVRQDAFVHLQDLKKQQREKNKYFFKYRDDSRAASEMALNKDRAALQNLSSDQVENFMNTWNNNDEFRNYYVRSNTRSTLRRLGTLDGRSLGPDEEPHRIAYAPRADKLRTSSDRAVKHETDPPVSAQQEKVVKHEGPKVENNSKAEAKPAEQKSQTTKSKKTVKPDQPPPVPIELVAVKEEIEKAETKEEEEEPPKLTKEEEELIKNEEEKRKQKEAAKMKEQHRLEEIAKAKEAMERKKKREEKAKARAVLKAQKEAEEREKEREKKLRKKERRKGVNTSEEATGNPIETAETITETPREIEITKKQTAEESQQTKKSHKPASQFIKQNKSKSIPLPLRNRGSKRKLKQWMWIGLVVLVVLALFLLGNANLSFSPANLWFI